MAADEDERLDDEELEEGEEDEFDDDAEDDEVTAELDDEVRPHARLGFVTFAAFDAGARLLVEAARNAEHHADTVARLDALLPLLEESRSGLAGLHGLDLS